jgi:hypothetical protein
MKNAPATGVRGRDDPGIGGELRGRVEPLAPVNLCRNYAAKEWTNPRNALQELFLYTLTLANGAI